MRNIDFGFPEILFLCGTWLITSGNLGFGIASCSMGLLGSVFRAGQRIQKQQQEEQARQKLLEEMNNAGEELAEAFASLFKGSKSNGSGPLN